MLFSTGADRGDRKVWSRMLELFRSEGWINNEAQGQISEPVQGAPFGTRVRGPLAARLSNSIIIIIITNRGANPTLHPK